MMEVSHLKEQKWYKDECNGCKEFNRECRLGACCVHPYRNWEIVNVKEKEDQVNKFFYYQMN